MQQRTLLCIAVFFGIHIVFIFGNQHVDSILDSITIEECCRKAEEHYPALTRIGIIEKTKNFNLQNANKVYLPQGTLSAQASLQSDITRIDLDLPDGLPQIDIPQPDKDQYRVIAEFNQLIWDGGRTPAQKRSIEADAKVEKLQLESELYALHEKVYDLYFGILLMKEHLKQQEILENELQRKYKWVVSLMRNGLASEPDLSAVRVEQLKAGQQRIQLEANFNAYSQMLSVMVGENLNKQTLFVKPSPATMLPGSSIDRPEMRVFEAQEQVIESQRELLNANIKPSVGAFLQGGYGKPGLNMFNNEFSPYLIGGIRFSWNFAGLYTLKNNRRKIDLQKETINTQRQLFLRSLHIHIPQQQIEVEKYRKTMCDDAEIIRHRELIRKAAEVKVENGMMTVSDLMKEINAEEAAKQAKSLHEIEYLLSVYKLKHTTNQFR